MAPAWVIADDPQTLGEAVMLGALVSYIARPPDRLNLLRTAFLLVLGGFIKHNLVAIPIAITLDLGFRSPRRLPLWLASCAGFTAGFLGLTQIVAGGDFIDQIGLGYGHGLALRRGWFGAFRKGDLQMGRRPPRIRVSKPADAIYPPCQYATGRHRG